MKDIEQVVKQPKRILSIKEDETAAEAAKKMSSNHVGCLVVLNAQGEFAGVLSERDMLAKVLATSLSPDNVLNKDIMTPNAIYCNTDTEMAKVEQLMAKHNIRHVPVVENGIPVGMISSRDVIAYRLHSNKAMKAAAEQLAILSAKLKGPDFNNILKIVINEVPRIFEADRSILYFAQKHSSTSMIYRKGCSLSEEDLPTQQKITELSENGWIICGKICDECIKSGGEAPRLVIPLSTCEQPGDSDNTSISHHGFICMCRFNPPSAEQEELQLYKASLLQEILNVNLTNSKLYQNYKKARQDSETDPLTGVGTRRVIEKVLKAECARAIRYNRSFCIAIADIDNFKQINDNAGHAAGDKVLQELAKIMRSNVREMDIVARYGGDEFVILMPETKISDANVLLERLRHQIETISLPNIPSVTISCGLAEWDGSSDTAELMMKRADAGLYAAKRAGRNRIVCEICA